MNKQKQTYLSPETETLVIRFEDSILVVASPTNEDMNGTNMSGGWVVNP